MDVRNALVAEYGLVADLNVEAYREFASSIGPEHWTTMEANLRNVDGRAKESELIVAEVDGSIAGVLAYYPPGGPRSFALWLVGEPPWMMPMLASVRKSCVPS